MTDDQIAEGMSKRLMQDAEAAAIAYGSKHYGASRPNVAQSFLDGVTWMMQRVPSFVAEMKGSLSESPTGKENGR